MTSKEIAAIIEPRFKASLLLPKRFHNNYYMGEKLFSLFDKAKAVLSCKNVFLEMERLFYDSIKRQNYNLAIIDANDLLKLYLLLDIYPDSKTESSLLKLKEEILEHIKKRITEIDLTKPIKNGNTELVADIILKLGGATIKKDYLPLAICWSNQIPGFQLVQLLIDNNAPVDAQSLAFAIGHSTECVKLLLKYSNNQFPSGTFAYYKLGIFVNIGTYEVVVYLINMVKEKNEVMHNILSSDTEMEDFWTFLKRTLQYAIEHANYAEIKLIVEFLEENNVDFNYPWDTRVTAHMFLLPVTCKSFSTLKDILKLLKSHNILTKVISAERFKSYYIHLLPVMPCSLEILEILKIMEVEPDTRLLRAAIVTDHTVLQKYLISQQNICPTDEILRFVIIQNKLDFIKILIDAGKGPTIGFVRQVWKSAEVLRDPNELPYLSNLPIVAENIIDLIKNS